MLFGWDEAQDAHQQVYDQQVYDQQDGGYDNQAKFFHEALGGVASNEAMKHFDHQCKEDRSPQIAKELYTGFAGVAVNRLLETKGMDEYDAMQARYHAVQQVSENMYGQHYVQDQGADQYNPNQHYVQDQGADQYDPNQHYVQDQSADQYNPSQSLSPLLSASSSRAATEHSAEGYEEGTGELG